MNLSEKKKDFIADCIIMFAKFEFRIEFMQWYIKNKIDTNTNSGEEKKADMDQSIKLAKTMAQHLVNFISQTKTFGHLQLCPS